MLAMVPGLPPLLHQALAACVIALWLVLTAAAALSIRRRWPERQEWSRKLVHVASGAVPLLAWWLGIERWLALGAAAAVTLVTAGNHRWRWLPAIEDVGRNSYGTVAYGAAITTLVWLYWPQRADLVCTSVLVMALGDGLAGLLGAAVNSPGWSVLGQRKSLLGTATMLLTSGLAIWSLQAANLSLPQIAAVALMATLMEQLAWGGIDNLTVPLGTALLLQRLQ